MTVEINRSIFSQRLDTARRGDWILYHSGFLYEDRASSKILDGLRRTVYASYLAGKTTLVQRRQGDKNYDYYAVVL